MITKQFVCDAIDAAECEFDSCFDVLVAMMEPKEELDGKKFLALQPKLIRAVGGLEKVYRSIKQEEKLLIGRKSLYSPLWFRKRMALLARYTKAIKEALAIGRAIGDGYAWPFYEGERDLIAEHLKQQPQLLLPPNLGAAGERLFVENMQGVDGKLLIYHGTTSFLRIGDITLIDLHTARVACIGEIKTERLDDTTIGVSVHLIASERGGLPKLPKKQMTSTSPRIIAPTLTPAMTARLDRQRERMSEALVNSRTSTVERVDARRTSFHYEVLEDIVAKAHTKAFQWVRAGNGLLLGAARLPKSMTLSDRLLPHKADRVEALIRGVEIKALEIMAPETDDNSLFIGSLGGGSDGLPVTVDAIPFVQWPIDTSVMRDILFGRVLVMSLFNPAHIWQALRQRGYEVILDKRGHFMSAKRRFGDKEESLENFGYFLRPILDTLMTEESVLSMIDQLIEISRERSDENAAPVRVEFQPRVFRWGKRLKQRRAKAGVS